MTFIGTLVIQNVAFNVYDMDPDLTMEAWWQKIVTVQPIVEGGDNVLLIGPASKLTAVTDDPPKEDLGVFM